MNPFDLRGKTMVITLDRVEEPNEAGVRDLTFTVDGNRRVISIKDRQALTRAVAGETIQFANDEDLSDIGANIPGTIVKVLVEKGDEIQTGQPVAVIEAMKMETNVIATRDGVVEKVYVKEGASVKSGQLVVRLESEEQNFRLI